MDSQGILRVLWGRDRDAEAADVDILLIPGVATPAAYTWPFSSPEWLDGVLPPHLKRPRVLAFEYTTALETGDFSFQAFLLRGDELLRALSDMRSDLDVQTRPLFCVCQSLGGIVFKQALCIANEQPYRYGSLLQSVAGIIFLGTPHMASSEAETLTKTLAILNGLTKKKIDVLDQRLLEERTMLCRLATRFENLNIQVPILSIYESKATKLGFGLLKSRSHMLCDKNLCGTNASSETLLQIPSNHVKLCQVDLIDRDSKHQIHQFITETLREAEAMISARLEALEFKYATTSTYSPIETEFLTPNTTDTNKHNSTLFGMAGSIETDYDFILSREDTAMPTRQLNLPCVILEPQSPDRAFFGREEILNSIRDALVPKAKNQSSSTYGLRQFALCGLGGVGKTEIATEFGIRYQALFDAVFWVQSDETAKLDDSFQQISIKLGLETKDESKNQVVTRSLVKGWLSNPIKNDLIDHNDFGSTSSGDQNATWLIIFDNADDPRLLADYWPQGSGSVLITSRDPLAKQLFSSRTCGMDLDSMGEQDGGALLQRLTAFGESEEADATNTAQRISQSLGGLPLAISQMAGIIRRQDLTLSEFLSIYEDSKEHAALHGMNFNLSPRAYTYNIATVWAFEKLSFEAQGLLKIIALMDPDGIQEDILYEVALKVFGETSYTKLGFSNSRSELSQSSLIKRDKSKNRVSEYRITAHRLLQDAVRAKMSKEDRLLIFGYLVDVLWTTWPSAMGPPSKPCIISKKVQGSLRLHVSRYPLCAALYPHVLVLKQVWASNFSPSDSTRLKFAALLNDAAWYQCERGRSRDFDGFWDLALDLCNPLSGEDRDAVLCDIHFCLGEKSSYVNDNVAARKHREQFFAIQKRICDSISPGYEDERLGLAYEELGDTCLQDGLLEEGISFHNKEREIRKTLGIKVPLSRDATLAFGLIEHGDLDVAEKVLSESLDLADGTGHAKESRRVALIHYAMGNLRMAQSRYDEAYECHSTAYKLFMDTIGPQGARTADTRHKLAQHLLRMRRYDEAIDMIHAALQTWSYDAEVYKGELARSTLLKAIVLKEVGKTQKANVAFRVADRLRRETGKGGSRDIMELKPEDLDKLVTFWSR